MGPAATIKLVVVGVIGFIALCVVGGSFYNIDEFERGILTRNGAYIGVATPGLGWKKPFIEGVTEFSTKTRIVRYDKVEAYSYDTQLAKMRVSANIMPSKQEPHLRQVYTEFGQAGYDAAIHQWVEPNVSKYLKIVFGKTTSTLAIQDRDKLNIAFEQELHDAVDKISGGALKVVSTQLEDVTFSEAYDRAIDQRMTAQVEVERFNQNLARERVQANIRREQARAESDAIEYRGKAEAGAIEAKAKALASNPRLIELIEAERWNGVRSLVTGTTSPIVDMRNLETKAVAATK